jgi:hypothetical protein
MERLTVPPEVTANDDEDGGAHSAAWVEAELRKRPDVYVEVWYEWTTEADYDVLIFDEVEQRVINLPPFHRLEAPFLFSIGART